MSTTRDLYHLQELELAIDANEQSQSRLGHQLKDNHLLLMAKGKLEAEQKRLDETGKQQKTVDFDIEDLSTKIKTINRKLYDGKTTNSKELSNLQTEYEDFRKKRSALEDKSLELMGEIEAIRENIVTATQELTVAEAEWEARQKIIAKELEQMQTDHASLVIKREALIPQIEPAILEIYKVIKKRKGTGVAKVEQGTCRGCRIAVSNAELQQAKSNNIVKCNSCGRILYLA